MNLGSGSYEVLLYDRGATSPIGALRDIEALSWNRHRDDISSAVCTINGAFSLSRVIAQARTVRHEMVVFRDGKRVWEGPLTRIEAVGDRVELDARDILWFTSRTAVNTHASYTGKGKERSIIDVAERLLAMTYDKGNDWLKAWAFRKKYRSKGDMMFRGEWVGYAETVYDVLERMAQDWDLDYAAVGRRIYWNDVHTRIAYTYALTDADFLGDLAVTEYGADLVTERFSTGSSKVYRRRASQALLDYYGPIQDTSAGSEGADPPILPPVPALTNPVLTVGPAPVRVRLPDNTALSPKAPVGIEQLVAGAWLPVRTDRYGRAVDAWMKVDQVNVTWSPDAGENVALVTSAAPSAMEDPT